jgi:hypothetical protein
VVGASAAGAGAGAAVSWVSSVVVDGELYVMVKLAEAVVLPEVARITTAGSLVTGITRSTVK